MGSLAFTPAVERPLAMDVKALDNILVKLIEECLCTTQSRPKSYANRKVHDMAFLEDGKVLPRVSPMKGMMRFLRRSSRVLSILVLFDVLELVREVSYKLALPPSLSGVHLRFHVYMLRKYYEDHSYVLDFSSVRLDENLAYEEESVAILNRQGRKLRSKYIGLVKV
ncbi:uncharacterized protein LOC142168115 [Nicotiana tabacum]|uniref:Uncharacterized protein LOC142168115 n=1 Tax=Nicotiana tabacum TaxID=4097 RepID=A0AC58SIS3_TOBAC